jgi:hypothetical protein
MFYEQMEASRQQSYSLGYLFDKKSGRHLCQSPWDHADIAGKPDSLLSCQH